MVPSILLMNFTLEIVNEEKPSPSVPLSVVVSRDVKKEIQAIKKSSEQNRRIISHLTRQFFSQIIEKFHAGEFDETSTT